MIISVTERGSYKRCRRQWMINSRNRWGMTRIVAPSPLALGTLIHSTLGIWLDMYKADTPLPSGGLADLFLQYANKTIADARQTYERQTGMPMSDGELAPLYESVLQGRCMMDNYQARWGQPIPDGFEIISTEQRCVVPIPGTEHRKEIVWVPDVAPAGVPFAWRAKVMRYRKPRLHYLEGKLDAIIREKRSGRLYVLEHKSYGQRPREDVLFSNDQFLAYHWLLLVVAGLMGLDVTKVAGVAYDGLWKRASPPKVVDGHPGTLMDLFCRRLITRPHQELVEFEDMLASEVLEMANDPPIYLNRTADGSCFWGCSDNQLCLAMSRGEDYAHMLRSQYRPKDPDADMDPPREQ
jgi:PD-(D/E)XK nuclease superfamily